MKKRQRLMRTVGSICIFMLLLSALAVAVDVSPVPDRPGDYVKATALAPAKLHPSDYTGRIRVYAVEPHARWNDYQNQQYHFGFLNFPLDSAILLPDGSRYHRTITWNARTDGGWAGVTETNVMFIAAVFNSEPHPANSDTGIGTAYPFNAFYVDAAAAAEPGQVDSNNTTGSSTHTVFVHEGTATWCPPCATANYYLYSVYASGNYNFFYAAMVIDKNSVASSFVNSQFNLAWLPTCYGDGGDEILIGGWSPGGPYQNMINACAARAVYDIGVMIGVTYLGDSTYQIELALSHGTPVNTAPAAPGQPTGADTAVWNTPYDYSTSSTDPESDPVYYRWDWGDGDTSAWLGPYNSGDNCMASHQWTIIGAYQVEVQCRDPFNEESGWSAPRAVTVKCCVNRGNVDGIVGIGGPVDVADLTYLVAYLFQGGPAPPCEKEGNVDGIVGVGGAIDVADLTYMVSFLFQGGSAPPPCD